MWRQQRLDPWKKEVARLLAGMFRAMRPDFEGSVGGKTDFLLQVIKRAYGPLLKAAPFTTVLQKLVSETIPLVEAVEQRPLSLSPQPKVFKRAMRMSDDAEASSSKIAKRD